MNYKTYLFDFDYTLADSSRGIVKCFRIVLTRHQYLTVTDEAIKRTIGKTLEESFSILTGITDPAQLEAFRQEYRLEADVHMNVNTRLFPDTLSTLKELKKRNGQQFKAEAGKIYKLFVHHIQNAENGTTVEFDKVLLVDKDGAITVGAPTVEGAKVVCQIVSSLVKGDKVLIFHKKRRKGHRKLNGHRQQFTELTITEVVA